MANEPKVLNVNYQTTTEKVSGGQGTSSATVSSAPKELQKSEQSQVGVDLTNVKGTATGNTEERSLKVSKDATVGSYVADTNRAGNPGRTKRNIVNTVTVEEAKALIKKYGGGDSYSKEQIDEMLATIREGQYVKVDTTEYPTLEDFLASEGEQGTVYLYPVSNEENNYYQYIWEVSEWVSLGKTALDLSGYPTLNGNNRFSGNNTFSGKINPNASGYGLAFPDTSGFAADSEVVDTKSNQTISADKIIAEGNSICFTSSDNKFRSRSNGVDTYISGKHTYAIRSTNYLPMNSQDLGSLSFKWKDLYLAGSLNDGTNSVTIADLKALIDYAKTQGWIS